VTLVPFVDRFDRELVGQLVLNDRSHAGGKWRVGFIHPPGLPNGRIGALGIVRPRRGRGEAAGSQSPRRSPRRLHYVKLD